MPKYCKSEPGPGGSRSRRGAYSARSVSGAVIIGRSAAAVPFIMVGPLALARVLVGLVMADNTARACSEQPVVTGKMPGNPADDRPFHAALGRRRSGT